MDAVGQGQLLYSVEEAARYIGLGRTKFLELLDAGSVESVTIGTRRLVPADSLFDYVERLRGRR